MKGLNAFNVSILLIGGLFYSPLSSSAMLQVDCDTDGAFTCCDCVTLTAKGVWKGQITEGDHQKYDLGSYSGPITGVLKSLGAPIDMGPVEFKPQCTLTIKITDTIFNMDVKEFDNKCPEQIE